jgi:signal transduction histidine kinase
LIENIILLINALPLPVFIQDLNDIYIDCNDRFAMYINRKKSDIIGKNVFEIIDNEELARKASSLNEQLLLKAKNDVGQYSWAGNSLTNTYKNFVVNKSLLRDNNGELFGIIGVITDLTNHNIFKDDLVKTQISLAQEGLDHEALRLLNHEFRTPMNAIRGLTDILYKKEEDEEKRKMLNHIKISNERLLKLIINVLHIAEIESDEFSINYEIVNIGAEAEKTVANFEAKAKEKNVSLIFSEDNSIPDEVLTSRFAITLILSNLISNAIKYSFKGNIVILLRNVIEKDGNLLIEISVEDEGIGLHKHELGKIFEKFVQVNVSAEKFFTGAGLGLNIVKQIVEALDGKINVESEVGKGSKFTVVFPVKKV